MKKINIITVTLISLLIFAACGSMVAYKKGDNTKGYLQGVKTINVKFDYSKTAVGKFSSQQEYIAKKEADGKVGFGEKWETQKTTVFIPKFESLINKYTKDKGLEIGTKVEGDLNMVVYVTHIEPGWNIGISRRNATINLEIEIFKKGETEPVVIYGMKNVPGGGAAGFDFDAGYRIGQCFAKAGKELGAFFSKD